MNKIQALQSNAINRQITIKMSLRTSFNQITAIHLLNKSL